MIKALQWIGLFTWGSTCLAQGDLIIRETSLPENLNPVTSSGATAQFIQNNIFAALMEYDPQTLKLRPMLAVAAPTIQEISKGAFENGMSLTYEIRPEAVWDNGTPVTGYDYLFTVKVVLNPLSEAGGLRSYYEFIDSVHVDSKHPKKFTIYSKQKYFTAAESSGELQLLPEYVYDPEHRLRGFSIPMLKDPAQEKTLQASPAMKSFSARFASPSYENDPEYILGAGPYNVTEWTDTTLVLTRKASWWGDKASNVPYMKAYPQRIIYKIFPDNLATMKAFKEGRIQVYRDMPPAYFLEQKDHPKLSKEYEFSSPEQFSYAYIGFNMKSPKLSEKAVRQALAHLVDRNLIISDLYNGLAIATNSPVHPSKSYYHKGLADRAFDPALSKKILTDAGWKDSNGNGILDKTIGGQLVELKLSYRYNEGNIIRRNIGLLLQSAASPIGVQIDMVERPWAQFIKEVRGGDAELFSLAWVQGPGLDDMKQLWHTSANDPGGSNPIGFGNATTDQLIEDIRHTLDETKRNELYKKFQEIIYDEQPYIFLVAPLNRIAISRKLTPSQANKLSPGYQERLLQKNG